MRAAVEYVRQEVGVVWSDDDGGGRWIVTRTRNMANQIWMAGKHLTLWMLVLGSVPILLPVFIFSFFAGLLFAVPILSGIGACVLFFHVLYPSFFSKHLPRGAVSDLQSAEPHFNEKSGIAHEGGYGSQDRTSLESYDDGDDESKRMLDAVLSLRLSDDDKGPKEVQEVVDICPGYQGSETDIDALEVPRAKEVPHNGHHHEEETSMAKAGPDGGLTEREEDSTSFKAALAVCAEGGHDELLESNGTSKWSLPQQQKYTKDSERGKEEAEVATTFSQFSFPAPPQQALMAEAAAESLVGYKLAERPEEAQRRSVQDMLKTQEKSEEDLLARKMPGAVPHEEDVPEQSLDATSPHSEYGIQGHLDANQNGEARGSREWTAEPALNVTCSLEKHDDKAYAPTSSSPMYERPQQRHRFKEFGTGYEEWPEHRKDIMTSHSSEFPPGSTVCTESIDVFSGEFEGLLSYWRARDKGKPLPSSPPSTGEIAWHLRSEITVIQKILGEAFPPQFSLWKDVEKLSEIVGIELPEMGAVSDLTKARTRMDPSKLCLLQVNHQKVMTSSVTGISRKNTTTTAGAMTPPLVQVLNCILKLVFYLLLPFLLGQLSSFVEEYVFVMKAISKFVFYLLLPFSLDNCHLWWKNVSSS
ncbi:unnamed protein product [Sphagnum balticum]